MGVPASEQETKLGLSLSTDGGLTAEPDDIQNTLTVSYVPAGSTTPVVLTAGPDGLYTVPAGVTSLSVGVPTVQDSPAVFEGPETFSLTATSPSPSVTAGATGVGTITDDGTVPPAPPPGEPPAPPPEDDRPTVTVGDATATEGNQLVFAVGLSNASELPVTVTLTPEFTTGAGKAVGADIGPLQVETTPGNWVAVVNNQITLAPGTTSVNVRTLAIDDALFESTETFSLKGDATVGGKSSTDSGLGTINDNDAAPSFSVNDVTVTEGGLATFTITRTGDLSQAQSVTAATSLQPGNTAEANDFTARSGVVVQFAAGQATATFTVQTTADEPNKVYEGAETYSVVLSNPTNGAVIGDGTGLGTITDENDRPSVTSVGNAVAIEGNNLDFAVGLSNVSELPTTVTFRLTGTTATVGTDTAAPQLLVSGTPVTVTANADGSFSASIPANTPVNAITVRVPTTQDTLIEATESLTLSIGTVANATPLSGTGKILDNDAATDTRTTPEDTSITGNVLTNDNTGTGVALALTTFTVAGLTGSFAAGQTANVVGVGNITLRADGSYTFNPATNYSGAVPVVTYNGTKTDAVENQAVPISSTLTITVTPVADAPVLTITPKTFGLTENFESVAVGANGYVNVLATSIGTGLWRTDNNDVPNGNSSAVGQVEVGIGNTYGITSPVATNKILELEQDPSNRGNFYTVINNTEAGEVYTLNLDFAARQNNAAANNSVVYVYWEGQLVHVLNSTSGTLAAIPQLTLLATGPNAKLEFIAADSNSYGGVIDNISLQLLANTGIAGNRVNLSDITAELADKDGSESLAVSMTAIPVGATLTDGTRSVTVSSLTDKVDISGWNLNGLYLLNAAAGTYTLQVTATATESGTPVDLADKTEAVTKDISVTLLPDTGNLVGSAADDTNLVGTTGNDRMWGLEGNDTLAAGNGNDTLMGGAGTDTLRGEAGTDVLDGGVGNDTLFGGAARDIIQGGKGADTMTGGDTVGNDSDLTSDVFRWSLGDGGSAGSPVNDTINDFNAASVANNGDVLDLRDLLVGETADVASLRNYLDFDTTSVPGQTVIRISTTGGFANGNYVGRCRRPAHHPEQPEPAHRTRPGGQRQRRPGDQPADRTQQAGGGRPGLKPVPTPGTH